MIIRRRAHAVVVDRLRTASAVVLLGPRQVGKTTLARAIASARGSKAVYLDLERPADRRRLADADAFLRAHTGRLVVIDEIHRAPGLFEILRGIIDDRRAAGDRTGHFLLLGSAALDLMRQATESLAGRVAYVELAPIDAGELPRRGPGVDALPLRGGLPERRLPTETIARLWGTLAHGQGTLRTVSSTTPTLQACYPGRDPAALASTPGSPRNVRCVG